MFFLGMFLKPFDLLFYRLQIGFGRFISRIKFESIFIVRLCVLQIGQRVLVALVHVGALFQCPPHIEMTVFLEAPVC